LKKTTSREKRVKPERPIIMIRQRNQNLGVHRGSKRNLNERRKMAYPSTLEGVVGKRQQEKVVKGKKRSIYRKAGPSKKEGPMNNQER